MLSNNLRKEVQRIKTVKSGYVYFANQKDGTFSHHASITWFKGKFYAMWSAGDTNEDDVGQCVKTATSDDGLVWSLAHYLFPPAEGNAVLTAAGFYADDGILSAYAGLFYYPTSERPKGDILHSGTTLLVKSSKDGKMWSETVDLKIPVVPNQGPQKLKSGRLLICGNVSFPYSDNVKGTSDWKMSSIPPLLSGNMYDDSEGLHIHSKLRKDGLSICEGSFFERDKKIIMLLRNLKAAKICLTESCDDGASWSNPTLTEFVCENSKFYCMRLSDGRFAVISNPEPKSSRCPLSITLSDNGVDFDIRYDIVTERLVRRFDGMCKGGIYGYPHAVEHENKLYIICSVNKEDVKVFSFELSELI